MKIGRGLKNCSVAQCPLVTGQVDDGDGVDGRGGPGGVLVLVDHLAPAQETLEGGRHNHPPTCLAVDCLFHIWRI